MIDGFRNYDQWKTASPYDDYGWEENYPRYRCEECGCFLKDTPYAVETGESREVEEDIDGGTVTLVHTWTLFHRLCAGCDHVTTEVDA